MLSQFDLSGRVALVTGGAGLLGKQHAEALLEAGAKVILADINWDLAAGAAAQLSERWDPEKIQALALDVTNPKQVEERQASLLSSGTRVSILVNNAAIDAKVTAKGMEGVETTRVEHFPLARWEKELSVGLTGSFLCSQVFGSAMAKAGQGVILNIASDLSVIAPDQRLYQKPGLAPEAQPVKPITYSVIKTALIGMTRYLAAYWAASGVRVNALSPGGVYTEQPEEFVMKLSALIPMGRMAQADEYRSAVQFLCSDASRYLTGQNLVMDGGRSIL